MVENIIWIAGLIVAVWFVDRALLWMESRGWIYYRRTKPGRGAMTYHLFEWNAAFDPTMRQVQEEQVREVIQEEEAGDPPVEEDDPEGLAAPLGPINQRHPGS